MLIPFVALVETYVLTLRTSSHAEAESRHALLKAVPAEVLWNVDEPTALTAASLKGRHRLPLAAALVAALAITTGAVLVHEDPHLEALSSQVEFDPLPYKAPRRR